jgi:drug/metabolite transporter (DMT)-like permease
MGPTVRAALWMIGSIVSFSSMAVAGREAGRTLDTFEIMLYRSLIGIVIVTAGAALTGRLGEITTRRMPLQITRNLGHFLGQNLWLYAVTVAPLAQVFALEFTMPLWLMLIALVFLGERLTGTRIVVALLGFVGILVITQPWRTGIGPGVLPAAAAALCFAFVAAFTKMLTRTETIICILFWLTTLQAIFGLVLAGWDMQIAIPAAKAIPYVLVIGIAGLVAHFCMTKALSLAPATVVVPIDFARLPLIAVVAMLLYAEPLRPEVFAGAVVIFAANYLNILTESRRRSATAQPAAALDPS